MRKYRNEMIKQLEETACNCCGKLIAVQNGMEMEGVCHVEIPWGYFSAMDGEVHSFDLCEDCYRRMIAGFALPVEVRRSTELL